MSLNDGEAEFQARWEAATGGLTYSARIALAEVNVALNSHGLTNTAKLKVLKRAEQSIAPPDPDAQAGAVNGAG